MFEANFFNLIISLLSPDKRSSSIIALLKPFSNQIQDLNDELFTTYKTFQSIAEYDSMTTYNRDDKVKYNKQIYKSTSDNNTTDPNNDNNWEIISPNYLGTDIRLQIDSTKMILEYGLNLWFDTLYVLNPGVSEIYITLNTNDVQSPFIIGLTEPKSSKISINNSDGYIGIDYSFDVYYGFTIHIPTAVYNTLGSNDVEREATVRNFADRYVNIGVFYTIVTY